MATSRKRACIPFEKDAKETRDIERKMEKREEGGEERRGEIERFPSTTIIHDVTHTL